FVKYIDRLGAAGLGCLSDYWTKCRGRLMNTLTLADWQQRARDLHIEGRAFIQGDYSAPSAGAVFDCISPVDGRVLAQVASCDGADADRAVLSARMAFESGAWSRLAPAKRKA